MHPHYSSLSINMEFQQLEPRMAMATYISKQHETLLHMTKGKIVTVWNKAETNKACWHLHLPAFVRDFITPSFLLCLQKVANISRTDVYILIGSRMRADTGVNGILVKTETNDV